MWARASKPSNAQVIGQHDRGIGGQKRGAFGLGAMKPVRAGLIRPRLTDMLDQEDERMGVVTRRLQRGPGRFQDVGVDHVDAGRVALSAGQLPALP